MVGGEGHQGARPGSAGGPRGGVPASGGRGQAALSDQSQPALGVPCLFLPKASERPGLTAHHWCTPANPG